jgi:hypothetical protein
MAVAERQRLCSGVERDSERQTFTRVGEKEDNSCPDGTGVGTVCGLRTAEAGTGRKDTAVGALIMTRCASAGPCVPV